MLPLEIVPTAPGADSFTLIRDGKPVPAAKILAISPDKWSKSFTTDAQGRVYVANGQIFVYAPDGQEIGRIDVPERPLQLVFGGKDGKTLYILTHHALYATRPQ